MNQERDLVEEERRQRLAADAADRPVRSSGARGGGGMDAGTRKLALLAGGLGALLVLMVGGWSLLGRHQTGVPILAPPAGPIRVRPVDPGGMQLMGAQVAQSGDQNRADQALAPAPEQAEPQALQAQVDAARHADAPPAAEPAPVAAPSQIAEPAPAAPVAEAPAAPVPAAPVPAEEAPAPVAAAPTNGRAVQLAALESDAAAHAEWAKLAHRAPALFAGHEPLVLPVSHDGRQFYRLRIAGFDSIAAATGFCGRAKAAGIACTLADF